MKKTYKDLKKENEDFKKKLVYKDYELKLLKSLLKTNSLMMLVAYDCYLYKKKTGKSLKI